MNIQYLKNSTMAIITSNKETRPEVSEADPREPKGNKNRYINVNTRTQKFESQYV